MKELLYKIIFKLDQKYFNDGTNKNFEKYKSYRVSLKKKEKSNKTRNVNENYITARPNPGAGIGHQIANWCAGYCYANMFGLKFAHIPFSSSHIPNSSNEWENFLNFANGEANAYDLLKSGYKKVRLPKFDNTAEDIKKIKGIIDAYSDEKVIFWCEQDQFYRDIQELIPVLQDKYYKSRYVKKENLIFNADCYNIVVHVRRGDIVLQNGENNENLAMRFQTMDYFVNALEYAISCLPTKKETHIYVFSQGKDKEFDAFSKFDNVHYCTEMSAMDSFLHMSFADALITSKSSFSYKPALLNRGIKFVPEKFWHGYPTDESWILLDSNGKGQ